MVKVTVAIKDGYEKIPFRFPDIRSAGKFMEIANEAAEESVSFRVDFKESSELKGEKK